MSTTKQMGGYLSCLAVGDILECIVTQVTQRPYGATYIEKKTTCVKILVIPFLETFLVGICLVDIYVDNFSMNSCAS